MDSQVTSHVLGPRGGTLFYQDFVVSLMKDLDPVFLLKKAPVISIVFVQPLGFLGGQFSMGKPPATELPLLGKNLCFF